MTPQPACVRVFAILVLVFTTWRGVIAQDYDPLAVAKRTIAPVDLTVTDASRSRDIPLRVYPPGGSDPAPVVLVSPGLGGSREMYAYLGQHWALRGYLTIVLQHPGSDAAVWQDRPPAERMPAMVQAASAENFLLRAADVPAVIDQVLRWHGTRGHPLAGRVDASRIGMSGHSFGALTTQAVSGQTTPLRSLTDRRITAAMMFSPSTPRVGSPARAFGSVSIPWMLMTGTNDVSPIGNADVASRLAVFPALPPGGKYELVLDKAQHSAFGDRPLPGDREARNPNHHRAILAVGTAFWDAWLRDDAAARAWLDGSAVRSALAPGDQWQRK